MGSSKDRKPRKTSFTEKTDSRHPKVSALSWLRKPAVWVGTLVLTVATAAVTGWLQPIVVDGLTSLTEHGDPITVAYDLLPGGGSGALSVSKSLSDDDLKLLNAMKPEDQTGWLESQGGVGIGSRQITLNVTGNRDRTVRLTDIRTVSQCEEPVRGGLIWMITE